MHLCSNKVWPTDRGVMKMLLHLCNFYIECRGGLLVQFILFFFCTIYKNFYIKISYQSSEIKQQTKLQKWWKANVLTDQSNFRVGHCHWQLIGVRHVQFL